MRGLKRNTKLPGWVTVLVQIRVFNNNLLAPETSFSLQQVTLVSNATGKAFLKIFQCSLNLI